jgi:hypothetical protein
LATFPVAAERISCPTPRGCPQSYAPNPHRVSRELFIAIGGVWFNRFYGGTVKRDAQGAYHISLLTAFTVDKWWSFEPNTEMYPPGTENIPENPPAEFDFAEFLGLPSWTPRPVFGPPPFTYMVLAIRPNLWSVYIPDEWARSLETEGNAASYWLHGRWARNEEFVAVDRNCDGWSADEIVEGPIVTRELLPTSIDPSSNPSSQWLCR